MHRVLVTPFFRSEIQLQLFWEKKSEIHSSTTFKKRSEYSTPLPTPFENTNCNSFPKNLSKFAFFM